MPRYVALCAIDQNKLELFSRLRAEHYAFLIAEQNNIIFGGPARKEDGTPETMIIVLEAESQQAAHAWISREPYNRNGGFSRVLLRPWSQVMPELEPGALHQTYAGELSKRST